MSQSQSWFFAPGLKRLSRAGANTLPEKADSAKTSADFGGAVRVVLIVVEMLFLKPEVRRHTFFGGVPHVCGAVCPCASRRGRRVPTNLPGSRKSRPTQARSCRTATCIQTVFFVQPLKRDIQDRARAI